MKAVTDAIEASLKVPRSTIHVMIQQVPSEDIMIGGEPLSDTPVAGDK
jgi:phenylpyruvate tautomerase PptA (4-oxalocrotonate tautomerase family)